MKTAARILFITLGIAAGHGTFAEVPVGSSMSVREYSAFLIDRTGVDRCLELTPSQREQLKQTQEAFELSLQQAARTNSLRADALEQILRSQARNVLACLQSAQQRRLFFVGARERGLIALLDEGVATEVGIEEDQRAELAQIYKTAIEQEEALFRKWCVMRSRIPAARTEADREKVKNQLAELDRFLINAEKKLDASTRALDRRALKVLTQPQQTTWRQGLMTLGTY